MLDVKRNIPLAPYTTFKVGGPAKFFCEASREEDILEALEYVKKNNLSYFILGGGSNLVISDSGFDGFVLKISNSDYKIEGKKVYAGSGTVLFDLVKEVANNSLSGFQWAAGIPGTLGGAVRGNAGAFWGSMEDDIKKVKAVDISSEKLELIEYPKENCEFEYRSSLFKKNENLIVVSALMEFENGNKDDLLKEIEDILEKRKTKQPQDFPSAGSFFKNPVIDNKKILSQFESDIGAPSRGNKVAAGWLIERVGMRGKKVGGAMISDKHANFLVSDGTAKAEDIIILASLIKQKVRTQLGIQLQEEVRYVGF